ncbi:MAG: chromate transporter [Clostridiales bacterium]|jgi:chromate transporter|nr:chromate transporter [Clostridiales bacterium]
MEYVRLFFSFFKIGLFGFGGGYAMIPFIQAENEKFNWISSSDLIDIIAISEMTPGPVAINSATFVGYNVGGILGGILATIGVALPSLLLILIIANIFLKFNKHPLKTLSFYGIRPVIAGLIISAALVVAETAFFKNGISLNIETKNIFQEISLGNVFIFILSLFLLLKTKINPILIIVIAGVLGLLL